MWCQCQPQVRLSACAAAIPPRSFITAVDEDAEINWSFILFCFVLIGSIPYPTAQALGASFLCLTEASACFSAVFFIVVFLLCTLFLFICPVSSFFSAVTSLLSCFPLPLFFIFHKKKMKTENGAYAEVLHHLLGSAILAVQFSQWQSVKCRADIADFILYLSIQFGKRSK